MKTEQSLSFVQRMNLEATALEALSTALGKAIAEFGIDRLARSFSDLHVCLEKSI